jgi:hypothetical protein
MRYFFTLVLCLITLDFYAQTEPDQWHFKFHYQDESYRQYSGPYEIPDLFGPGRYYSHFRGWSAGAERLILSKRNFDLYTGISFSKKSHILSQNQLTSPFIRAELNGLHHYYLSVPVTLKYTKNRIIQPGLVIEPGFRLFSHGTMNSVSYLMRGPGTDFVKIMPGIDISVSQRVKVFLGMSYTGYNVFGRTNLWAGGLQVGLTVNLSRRKSR